MERTFGISKFFEEECKLSPVENPWVNRTELAGAYPRQLCKVWAQAIRPMLRDVEEEPRSDSQPFATSLMEAAGRSKKDDVFFNVLQQTKKYPRLLNAMRKLMPEDFGCDGFESMPGDHGSKQKRSLSSAVVVAPIDRLRTSMLSSRTFEAYDSAVQEFEEWCSVQKKCTQTDGRSHDNLHPRSLRRCSGLY